MLRGCMAPAGLSPGANRLDVLVAEAHAHAIRPSAARCCDLLLLVFVAVNKDFAHAHPHHVTHTCGRSLLHTRLGRVELDLRKVKHIYLAGFLGFLAQ